MNKFRRCYTEAANYNDPDLYASDLSTSSIWEDIPYAEIPTSRIDWLRTLHAVYWGGVPALLKAAGLKQAHLSLRFGIPYKTVCNWCSSGKEGRTCPPYLLAMMAEILLPVPK